MAACVGGGYLLGASKVLTISEDAKEQYEKNKKEELKQEENNEDSNNSNEETKDLDLTKALNSNNIYDNPTPNEQDVGFELKINDDKKSVSLTINEKGSKLISEVIHSTWSTESITRQLKGFDKNIKSTFIGGAGQDAVGTIFFFLMEDGTVEYIKLFNPTVDSQGNHYYEINIYDENAKINTVENVNNVIKFYGANAHLPNSTGHFTTLAAKKDGSFYDLGEIIK